MKKDNLFEKFNNSKLNFKKCTLLQGGELTSQNIERCSNGSSHRQRDWDDGTTIADSDDTSGF